MLSVIDGTQKLPPGELLLLIDGTQVFHSQSLNCAHCYVREHRDGSTTWSHQVVVATVVHPQSNRALILGMEPIGRADGRRKNDSEWRRRSGYYGVFVSSIRT